MLKIKCNTIYYLSLSSICNNCYILLHYDIWICIGHYDLCLFISIDFDEQTADDWDVDMSVYYDPYGGDKDARDMVTMRRDARRRQGHTDKDDIDAANPEKIGHFEKYTKVSFKKKCICMFHLTF